MSLIPSLNPWLWAAFAAVPIGIVFLYFLKLRRQPLTVPSTFLWAKTVEDLHVNSLLQRLRTTPLLLLQLLAIALAAFALLRPGFRDSKSSDTKKVFLLDASASMTATDVGGSTNRFEAAKRLIETEVDSMTDQDVAMLLMFSDKTDVLQAFTSDRRRLRDALAAATVSNRLTNIHSAMRAADGLSTERNGRTDESEESPFAARDKNTELIVYSDGGFDSVSDLDTTHMNPRYVQIGNESTSNLSIIAFSAQRNEVKPGEVEAFATIANLGTTRLASSVSLRLNGELIDADEVSIDPDEEVGLSFQLQETEVVRLSLTMETADDLAIDNVAFAVLAPARTHSVLLVTPGNPPLEFALNTGQAEKICVVETVAPSYLDTEPYLTRSTAGIDQLIIYDRCSPKVMPAVNTFFIGAIPPVGWASGDSAEQLLLVDIDRLHPIMRYLDLFSILIAEGQTLVAPKGASDLLVAEGGPVLSLAPRDGFEDLVLGFEILSSTADGETAFNTDWQVQRSWPVFVFNVVRYLTGTLEAGSRSSHRPGAVVTLNTDRRQGELSIRSPSGEVSFVKPDPSGRVTYSLGDLTGTYEVEDEKKVVDLFCVNLFDRREATLASVPTVQLGETQVVSEAVTTSSRREYWRWLLVAMLGVLSVEWWYYGKRVGI